MIILHYLNRYECYISLLANLQTNHTRFASKEYKHMEVINYLNSVYYYNGCFLARCSFNDKVNVLRPIAIDKTNESYEHTKDLKEMLELSECGDNVVSLKIKVGDLLFPLTALYKTTAKQFKIFAEADIDIENKNLEISMKPFKKSTSVKESFSRVALPLVKSLDDKEYDKAFNFNVAMVVDVLKFYREDEFIIIKLFKNKENKSIDSFEISSYDKSQSDLIWVFRNMSFNDMHEYLIKNKS